MATIFGSSKVRICDRTSDMHSLFTESVLKQCLNIYNYVQDLTLSLSSDVCCVYSLKYNSFKNKQKNIIISLYYLPLYCTHY